ncbi:TetR family transcriptional regulator [Frondihabitans sp. PhB188]|uniref:TetR/AcrR family transcriptional regulator n=1 Tax=Frondihabitans sp. PhB188 TaxID=2485200 RepID=UPI000F4787C9|nr:TetR/AcrR family transcriptional regulator [Frondihabitans sp. PhB188]ROQ39672.1 TetR family transcriptional regulator [Frondihabitans sp. PhB188]
MDPRARRSRDRLTSAVLALAAAGRIDDVSVSEVARDAGVTRDTFYRHSSSVVDLLALALHEKLEEYLLGYVGQGMPASSALQGVLATAEAGLLRHIAAFGPAYRAALLGQNGAPVRRSLSTFLADNIVTALTAYPQIAPLPVEQMDDQTTRMIAAYAASGTVGAIEVWLQMGDLDDIEGAVHAIAAGAPTWWRLATGKPA